MPAISAIIVTFNSGAIVGRAIGSLHDVAEIICVDNASADGRDGLPDDERLVLIQNTENVGFGRACNQGARAARGTFLLFMNPDVQLQPGCIAALSAAIDRYPDCNVFAPRTITADGATWYRDLSRVERWRMGGKRQRHAIAGDCCGRFVDGGVFLIRRETFLGLGGFDENIFLYYEDDDLSQRLVEARQPIITVANAEASHDLGRSSPTTIRNTFRRQGAKKRSEIYLKRKYAVPYSRFRDGLTVSCGLVFYAVTLQVRRAASAAARLAAISRA